MVNVIYNAFIVTSILVVNQGLMPVLSMIDKTLLAVIDIHLEFGLK